MAPPWNPPFAVNVVLRTTRLPSLAIAPKLLPPLLPLTRESTTVIDPALFQEPAPCAPLSKIAPSRKVTLPKLRMAPASRWAWSSTRLLPAITAEPWFSSAPASSPWLFEVTTA